MAKDGLTPYPTDDTYHACYIRAIGGTGLVLDRSHPDTGISFTFTLTKEQAELADKYQAGATIVAIAFADAHRKLIALIKNPKRTQPEDE